MANLKRLKRQMGLSEFCYNWYNEVESRDEEPDINKLKADAIIVGFTGKEIDLYVQEIESVVKLVQIEHAKILKRKKGKSLIVGKRRRRKKKCKQ